MASALQIVQPDIRHRIRLVQFITITWMIIEAAASLFAAKHAHSPALFAFGGDSAIELLSAFVVLWSFRNSVQPRNEKTFARIVAALLFLLAACVLGTSAFSLAGHAEPRPTLLGIAVLIAAAIIMPLLASEKRKLSAAIGSATLRADAAQSGTCAYLSLIALAGLAINGLWHLKWADPVAALAIVPFILWEGREAVRGKPCGCC